MGDQRTSAGSSPDRVVVIIGGTSGIDDGAELPSLAWAQGVDPATTILVKSASSG